MTFSYKATYNFSYTNMRFVVESSLNRTFNLGFQFNLFLESIFMWEYILKKKSIANTAIKVLWVLTDSFGVCIYKIKNLYLYSFCDVFFYNPEWRLPHFLNQFSPLCCWYQSCYKWLLLYGLNILLVKIQSEH